MVPIVNVNEHAFVNGTDINDSGVCPWDIYCRLFILYSRSPHCHPG